MQLIERSPQCLPYSHPCLQLNDLIDRFPSPSSVSIPAEGSGLMSPLGTRTPLSRLTAPRGTGSSGVDFLIGEVVDMLGKIRCVGSVLHDERIHIFG